MRFIPWRLILFLIILVMITFFAGFNLQFVSISVGFYIFKDIPLFLALITFFILGALIMMPFTILGKAPSNKKDPKHTDVRKNQKATDIEPIEQESMNLADKETKKKRIRNRIG